MSRCFVKANGACEDILGRFATTTEDAMLEPDVMVSQLAAMGSVASAYHPAGWSLFPPCEPLQVPTGGRSQSSRARPRTSCDARGGEGAVAVGREAASDANAAVTPTDGGEEEYERLQRTLRVPRRTRSGFQMRGAARAVWLHGHAHHRRESGHSHGGSATHRNGAAHDTCRAACQGVW